MERKIILTGDGSHTISVPEMKVTYHSIHGAIQESLHVFIESGLRCFRPLDADFRDHQPFQEARSICVFEMGLGTGLNALLTLLEADKLKQPVRYTAIELFPLNKDEAGKLNYCKQLGRSHHQIIFEKLHECEWGKDINITPFFTINKINSDLINFSPSQLFNLIYYDAFAPAAQPELWTREIFEKLYNIMSADSIVVTYCSKGDVRRAMQAAGFHTEKIPGPPGKREVLRGRKFK